MASKKQPEQTTTAAELVAKYMPAELPSVKVPIADLVLAPVNPRRGDIREIMGSLQEFGQHRDVVVQASTMEIIVGNHMTRAAQMIGWTEISCKFVDDDGVRALRRAIADNATSMRGGWEEEELKKTLKLTGTDIPGLDEKQVERLFHKDALTEDIQQQEPIYPIAPRFSESYHAVVIIATNDTDFAFLQTALELDQEKSYKKEKVGLSQIMTAERFAELWRNRHGG